MGRTTRTEATADPVADPFGERLRHRHRRQYHLLGGRFHFDSNHAGVLALADAAFGGLIRRRISTGPPLQVSLRVAARRASGFRSTPPAPRFRAAAGMIATTLDADNYAVVCPAQRAALVALSPDLLRYPYHARYELIEFAVYTLATRALGLVPMHAACVGQHDRGLLLIGDSGAGKSTLSLLAALNGMSVHAEDVSFIDSVRKQAWTVPNYLHLRSDTLRWVSDRRMRAQLRRSPTVTRRGGARKLEVDLRPLQPAHGGPVPLRALVFLRNPSRRGSQRMRRLTASAVRAKLRRTQPFARTHSGWRALLVACCRLEAYEIDRDPVAERMIGRLKQLLRPSGAGRLQMAAPRSS